MASKKMNSILYKTSTGPKNILRTNLGRIIQCTKSLPVDDRFLIIMTQISSFLTA